MVLVLYMPSAIKNAPLTPLKQQGAEEGGPRSFYTWTSKQGVCVGSGGGGVIKVAAVLIKFSLQTFKKAGWHSTNFRKLYKSWTVFESVNVSLFYGLENLDSVEKSS